VVDFVKIALTFLIIFHKTAVHINMKDISDEVYVVIRMSGINMKF
jgi:hypothetical protein